MSPAQLVGYLVSHGFNAVLESQLVIVINWTDKTNKARQSRLVPDYCLIVAFVWSFKNV